MSCNNNQNNSVSNKTDNRMKNADNTSKKSQMPLKPNKTSVSNPKQPIDGINLDYDYNTEYGDGDIPDVDK